VNVAEWIIVVLLFVISFVILEARLTVGTRVVVMERDLRWITATLQKWGLVPPNLERK
jgi:hypothetical protein